MPSRRAAPKFGAAISCVLWARSSYLRAGEWPTPRASGVVLYLSLFLLAVSGSGRAQNPTGGGVGIIRYHFGDSPDGGKGWANANLNDNSWSPAPQGQWPEPAFYSDDVVWVRSEVPIRSDTAEPMALRIGSLKHVLIAYEVFVDGRRVGSFGRVPPDRYVEGLPRDALFDPPPGIARPGTIAHVALRIWYPPFVRRAGQLEAVTLSFDQNRTLQAEEILAPYIDGKELPLENGLPLGLVAEAPYADSSFQLLPSARLTLITDGIVEARNAEGDLSLVSSARRPLRQNPPEPLRRPLKLSARKTT